MITNIFLSVSWFKASIAVSFNGRFVTRMNSSKFWDTDRNLR